MSAPPEPLGRTAVVSWSGGKDSCLALHLAYAAGWRIASLLTMFERGADRSRSHALPAAVLQAQAEALGLPLWRGETTWAQYETDFVALLHAQRAAGAGAAVFGDIDLVPHRDWEEKVCAAAGLQAVLPLWDWPRARVVEAVFEQRIRAVVVAVNHRYLAASYCGRVYDAEFVASLPPGVDACGENGEFHTCVVDAPLFKAPLRLRVEAIEHYTAPAQYGGDDFSFARVALG